MRRLAPLLCLPLLAATACDKFTEAVNDAVEQKVEEVANPSPSGAPGGGAPPHATEEELANNKVASYAECLNRSKQRMHDSWARYAERTKEDGTPKRKNQTPFLYKIESELDPCKKAVDEGPKMQPSLPDLEAAAKAYYDTGMEFAKYTQELDTYYEQENFKDDDWAKAKEIAPKFAAAHDAWIEASTALDKLVSDKQDELDLALLALIEKRQGKDIEWHSRSYIVHAKNFLKCVEPEAVNVEACEKHFAALEEAEKGFREVHDGDKEKAGKVFWMSSYQSSVTDYYTEAKKLMREVRGGKALKPQMKSEVFDEYNDLVGDYNNLNFRFGS